MMMLLFFVIAQTFHSLGNFFSLPFALFAEEGVGEEGLGTSLGLRHSSCNRGAIQKPK